MQTRGVHGSSSLHFAYFFVNHIFVDYITVCLLNLWGNTIPCTQKSSTSKQYTIPKICNSYYTVYVAVGHCGNIYLLENTAAKNKPNLLLGGMVMFKNKFCLDLLEFCNPYVFRGEHGVQPVSIYSVLCVYGRFIRDHLKRDKVKT